MLYFSQRVKLVDEYKKYLKENENILDCAENFIAFLQENNLLNEEKCKEFLKKC